MLKIAYQLGVQAAFDEVDVNDLVKQANKAGLLRRAWTGLKSLSPAKKTLLGTGLGLGALGTGLALWPRAEEPSALSRIGSTAKDLLGNQQLMLGLTQSLAGGGGGAGMGLTPGDMETFPPAPETGGSYPATQAMPAQYADQYNGYM